MKRKEEEVEAACIEFTKLRNRLARHEGVLKKRVINDRFPFRLFTEQHV